jgi:hypothetical protein
MAAAGIDARAWAETVNFLREHELHHRPEFAGLLALIDPARPTPATVYRWRELQGMTAPFRAFHQEYPQVVAPPGTLDGAAFSVCAQQAADGQPVTIPDERAAQHIGIYGQSGGGKTTLAQRIATHAYERGLSVIIVDGKSDAAHFATKYSRTLVIAPTTPIPLLDPLPGLSRQDTSALLERTLKRVWWGGFGTEQVAHESIALTYERHEHPSVRDWRSEALKLHEKGETYNRRDRIDGLAARLATLIDYFPGIGTTRMDEGISLEDLCTRPVYFGYTVPGPAVDLLANWLFEIRFAYNRAHGIRHLNTIGVIDESHLFLHEETIGQTATFGATFPLLREFGIGIVLTATNYDIPPIVRANIATQIVMNVSDAAVARALAQATGIKDHTELLTIPRGECVIKTPDWPHAIRATFERLAIEKNIAESEWHAALQRTHIQARTAAAREETPRQPPTAMPSASASHTTTAPLIKRKVALNEHAETLLTVVAEHGVITTTEAFRLTNTHPQTGTRDKKQLRDLGLIEEERITIRRGRGGTAVAVRATAAGYARAGVKPRGTRGGDSIQHEWLVRQLATRVPKATIDTRVGTKAVDLLIPYNVEHRHLANFLRITPTEGELIGIEVEVSTPAKTAHANAEKNIAAGVAYTVIATMTPLQRTPKSALAVDVFELLEAL